MFRDRPLVAFQHIFSQRMTSCCAACMAPVGSFRDLLQQILGNAGCTLESFGVDSHNLLGHPCLRGLAAVPCDTEGCKALFCSERCRAEEVSHGAHRLLCCELHGDSSRTRSWICFNSLARNHSENLLLAASALSWAVCQVLYWDMPVQRAVAELMVCQNERWEQMTCRQPYRRRRVVRESWTLLKQVLYPARTAVDIDLLLNEEVYSRLLGEFELVNANIEFGHPFQAALAREALLPLSDALRRAGVWQAVAKVMSCQHEDSSVSLCSVDDDAPTQEDLPVVLGIGLARRIALMNHSCRPNCEIDYSNNGTAIVVALRELRAGEELTISYVDEQSLPVRRRRRALWLRYGFHCYCSRCSTERLQRRRIHRQALQGKSFGPQ